jgi:hypothetical protein
MVMSNDKKSEQIPRGSRQETPTFRGSANPLKAQRAERRIECEAAPLRQVYADRYLRRAPTR